MKAQLVLILLAVGSVCLSDQDYAAKEKKIIVELKSHMKCTDYKSAGTYCETEYQGTKIEFSSTV